ncbi:MAG: endonuclease/exonuclease/phosphatase family protein [Saprospiraceae bacterium]|nr:endonuclease/exonuclease/phosphatase family protein [Saprospiraceae bacterium]
MKYSYVNLNHPIYTGDFRDTPSFSDTAQHFIKVVSFNIEFAQHIDEAIELLQEDLLKDTDIFLLQEMDEKGTERLARKLNMQYVYYPSIHHPKHNKNVGNAILTKWNIRSMEKFILPYPSWYPNPLKAKRYIFVKIAAVADIEINGLIFKCVSTHAAAFNTTQKRRDFAEALARRLDYSGADKIIVGGDFNSFGGSDLAATVESFAVLGYEWATKGIGMTISEKKYILKYIPDDAFCLDHIFVKGIQVKNQGKMEQKGISDHLPIWVELKI